MNRLVHHTDDLYWLLDEHDHLLGRCWFGQERADYVLPSKANTRYLYNVEIVTKHRNKGFATEMLRKLFERFNTDVMLWVTADNEYALRLYKKFGFRKFNTNGNKILYKRKAGSTRGLSEESGQLQH